MAEGKRKSEKVSFTGSQGEELSASLELPAGEPSAYALFAHCFTCGKDVKAASTISRGLAEAGLAVLRFDFTGLGSSDGDFANTDFSSNVADLEAAAEWMRDHREAPALLVGHSLGGAAVLVASGRIPESVAVATVAAPFDPAHVLGLLSDEREEIEREGSAEVHLAGRPFRISREFIEDIEGTEQEQAIAALDKALVVFHSPVDEQVGIDNAQTIYQAARHPKSFVAIDGADHLLSDRRDSEFVARVLAAWTSRYLVVGEERG